MSLIGVWNHKCSASDTNINRIENINNQIEFILPDHIAFIIPAGKFKAKKIQLMWIIDWLIVGCLRRIELANKHTQIYIYICTLVDLLFILADLPCVFFLLGEKLTGFWGLEFAGGRSELWGLAFGPVFLLNWTGVRVGWSGVVLGGRPTPTPIYS